MAELNSQPPWSVAGGTMTFIEDPEASLMGSPLNVVPHNLLPEFAFNEDEDALVKSRVVEDTEPISSQFPDESYIFFSFIKCTPFKLQQEHYHLENINL
ncbi:hypothetical protein HanRHA438_Chr15g0711851 [Helianthus annuus]|nr:hypothetical protein HanIR_Chr15g0760741 [Helianthus annuus]KAJ0845281.1 hypothetical protein HanRHA438_Chr15g0711851 [Helianthus annuus]